MTGGIGKAGIFQDPDYTFVDIRSMDDGIGQIVLLIPAPQGVFDCQHDLTRERRIGAVGGSETFFQPLPQFLRVEKRGSPVRIKDADRSSAQFYHHNNTLPEWFQFPIAVIIT